MQERGPGEDNIIQLDSSNFMLNEEDEGQLAYYPKIYSGSHAKMPIPTATSIVTGKLQSRHNQMTKHQENYFTDMKHQKQSVAMKNHFEEEDDELELRRYLPATPRDDLDVVRPINLFSDCLHDGAPSVLQHQQVLTPAPHYSTPFIRDEAEYHTQ
jgi:hypothetical protein